MTPGQLGLAMDGNTNLYTENAATEAAYGGKIFRILGYRGDTEPAYKPPYPNPNPDDGAAASTGNPSSRQFVGTVNYYSRLINRANPVSLTSMIMGNASSKDLGEELYVADLMGTGSGDTDFGGRSSQIKQIAVRAPELINYPANHNVGQAWAWNDPSDTSVVRNDEDWLNFSPYSDLAFDRTKTRMFITQQSHVVQTTGGKNASFSITKDGTLFSSASGCTVCESNNEQFLFVADRALGTISRIPLADLTEPVPGYPDLFQLPVPANEEERQILINRYILFSDLDHPDQIRITDDNKAMVVADNSGLKYIPFGFSGQIAGSDGEPLAGAVVTIKTLAGEKSTVTDSEGNYHFLDVDTYSVVAEVSHPDYNFSEKIMVSGKCNFFADAPRPCVLITEPAHGAFTANDHVTVRGTIYPEETDFSVSGGELEVIASSGSTFYNLGFTGNNNDFSISNVALETGSNHLIVRTFKTGAYEAGGSLFSTMVRTSGAIATQAVSGIAKDSQGNPLPEVVVEILVDGDLAETTESDACGYYNAQNLPLGTLTVNVIE